MTGASVSIRSLPSQVLPKKTHIVELITRSNDKDIYSYGVSLVSKDIAHAKCVAEMAERLHISHFEEGGVGVGFNSEKAYLNALYELIERDAFMPYFLMKNIPIRIIDPTHILLELKKLNINKLPSIYSFTFFDITNDLQIPSIATVVSKKNSAVIHVGIKSNNNPNIALIGSLEEAILEITLKKKYGKKRINDAQNIFSTKHFKSIFMNKKNHIIYPPPQGNANGSFKSVYKCLRNQGQLVTFEEISSPIFKNVNYHIIKARSNTLQKIFFSNDRSDVNNVRLENIQRYYTIMEQNYEKNNT